jgi:hypothetical protein
VRKEAPREEKTAVRAGAKQKRLVSGNSQFINLIGVYANHRSIRRECLDHVIVFGERSLHRTLTAYCASYRRWRTHLSLGKDAPQSRRILPPAEGAVMELREVGGLHHHYERRAA